MSRASRSRAVLYVVVLLVGATACSRKRPDAGIQAGGGGAPTHEAASSRPPDLCGLLTPAEIEAATGVRPGEPSSTVSDACTWGAADGGNPRLVTLTARRATLTREQWLEAGGSEAHIVPGVGDLAVRVGSQLQVYQRGWQVAVAVRGSERENAARELALAAHARLAV